MTTLMRLVVWNIIFTLKIQTDPTSSTMAVFFAFYTLSEMILSAYAKEMTVIPSDINTVVLLANTNPPVAEPTGTIFILCTWRIFSSIHFVIITASLATYIRCTPMGAFTPISYISSLFTLPIFTSLTFALFMVNTLCSIFPTVVFLTVFVTSGSCTNCYTLILTLLLTMKTIRSIIETMETPLLTRICT
jgi:sensor histidine kinase YesM